MFITLEGIDNCGKSIQAKMLAEISGGNTVLTREPGGCNISEQIRNIIVSGEPDSMDSVTELLLINAARREHIKQVIKPALDKGSTVVCDRFIDSTHAYQNKIGEDIIHGFHKQLCFGLYPDIVFLIDIDPMVAFTRSIEKNEKRFEEKGMFYYIGVRESFLERAEKNPNTHIIIDGNQSIDKIHKIVYKELMHISTRVVTC